MSTVTYKKYPLQIAISTLFIAITLMLVLILTWQSFTKTSDIMLRSADELYESITQELSLDFKVSYGALYGGLLQFRLSPIIHAKRYKERVAYLPNFVAVLDSDDSVSSVGIAYNDGDYFGVAHAKTAHSLQRYDVPENASYVVHYINKTQQESAFETDRQYIIFFDSALNEIVRSDGEVSTFDPRQRIWYQQASSTPGSTQPYTFFESRQVGISVMSQTAVNGAVVVFDITLQNINDTVSKYQLTANSEVVLINAKGGVVAYKDRSKIVRSEQSESWLANSQGIDLATLQQLDSKVLTHLSNKLAANQLEATQQSLDFEYDGYHWKGSAQRVAKLGGVDLYALMLSPVNELLSEAVVIRNRLLISALLVAVFFIPLIWYVSKRISTPLKNLANEAEAIARFDFEETPAQASRIKEVDELDRAMEMMKSTINKFLNLINVLAGEQNLDALLKNITQETLQISQTDAALIYLLDEKDNQFKAEYLCDVDNQSLSTALLSNLDLQQVELMLEQSDSGRSRVISLDKDSEHKLSLLLDVMEMSSATAMLMPLQNRNDEIIGLMCLIYENADEMRYSSNIEFVEALSGFSAVTLESRQLFKMQEDLLHAFIKLIAGAIDAKSPYTGGHCQRVPEITLMLAKAACESNDGILHNFSLDDKQWEELSIACWLHDCGKVTTPEYVVDKATKLETIYDRIHEVRTRFEVLKRDAEIECWKNIAEGGDKAVLLASLQTQHESLDDDFAFVAECNVGGEFMADDKIERLEKIANLSWWRTLDDNQGLSWEELNRKVADDQSLPVEEKLLSDKAEHLIARHEIDMMPKDNQWGFKVDTPQYKYNRGELYNLSVKRGTLNEEERYMINGHMIQTIIMLNNLPFPNALRNVPLIAGSHHETMDGKGYPKKLVMSEQPLTARMMVIADIFEALTASDRPYKKAKTLSESLKILSFMRNDRHIDPDLFELFLREGVYLEYAEKFLNPEQIDEVDIEGLLAR